MTLDAATTSTPAPQVAAPGSQPAPVSPASQPTPVQLLWEVATLAFELMRRLVNVLQPIQQYYPKQALLLARLLIDIPRIFLTIRYAPERVTTAQLRHLTRARHILQALFNYTLPLGARTPSSANASVNQSPSASPENATPLGPRTSSSATTPSPAISITSSPNSPSHTPSPATTPGTRKPSPATSATPSIRQVPEIPMVAGVSHVPASSTVDPNPLTPSPSPISPDSHSSHPSQASHNPQSANNNSAFRIQHSAFSPFIPDFHTLAQALKADSLPPNCAGALFENPGEALVRALHQLHTIYFSLYPTQSPSPSQSSVNPQSGNPQSSPSHANFADQSVESVRSVGSDCLQSEISNLKSEIPNHQFKGKDPVGLRDCIPHSTAPP